MGLGGSNEMDRHFKKIVEIWCEAEYKEKKRRQSHSWMLTKFSNP